MSYAGNTKVKLIKPQKSSFDQSHFRRTTIRQGQLTPVFVKECIPGDSWFGNTEILVRAAPLLAPIYDEVTLYVHFFFVPNRLLWSEWEEFITGGRLGIGIDPVTAPIPPFSQISDLLDLGLVGKGTVADYLRVPDFAALPGYTNPASYGSATLDIMPWAAYYCIWFEYYRDRNFVPDNSSPLNYPLLPLLSGGFDPNVAGQTTLFEMKIRDYAKDYFTAALPFTQRGEEVLMPLAGSGSVTYLDRSLLVDEDGSTPMSAGTLSGAAGVGGVTVLSQAGGTGPGQVQNIDEVLLDASSVSINDFRSAYALQVWLERNAIGGSRYTESTQAHFGVRPQDSRLQRPEYIGGGRMPIRISEVLSTAYSTDGEDTIPLANMAGHGIAYGNTNKFRYFCPEHGFIMGIATIMTKGSYHQGLDRMFRRRTFLDYPWPTFAKLGEQSVDKVELFASPANFVEADDGSLPLFGYQSRYADWKQTTSSNHGDFHDELLFWTATRQFADSPVLGTDFLAYDPTTVDRMFAVQETDIHKWWCFVNNQAMVKRALPYFGTPNTLGFV